MRRAVIAALALAIFGPSAQAADERAMNEFRVIVSRLLGASAEAKYPSEIRERALDIFYATDIDGVVGVSQSDLDLAVQIQVAQAA